jgi:hypothetical protein
MGFKMNKHLISVPSLGSKSDPYKFFDLSTAFAKARACDRPIWAQVGSALGKFFPSGHAEYVCTACVLSEEVKLEPEYGE